MNDRLPLVWHQTQGRTDSTSQTNPRHGREGHFSPSRNGGGGISEGARERKSSVQARVVSGQIIRGFTVDNVSAQQRGLGSVQRSGLRAVAEEIPGESGYVRPRVEEEKELDADLQSEDYGKLNCQLHLSSECQGRIPGPNGCSTTDLQGRPRFACIPCAKEQDKLNRELEGVLEEGTF
jgi:hypothetical protein